MPLVNLKPLEKLPERFRDAVVAIVETIEENDLAAKIAEDAGRGLVRGIMGQIREEMKNASQGKNRSAQ